MVHALAFCGAARGIGVRGLSRGHHRTRNFLSSRLRGVRLSAGVPSPRELLGRRNSLVEPAKSLRAAVPCAMEYDDAVPAVAILSAPSALVVARRVLSGAFFSSRHGNVFSGASLDGKPLCERSSGISVFIQ